MKAKPVSPLQIQEVQRLLKVFSAPEVAKQTQLGLSTVYRIKQGRIRERQAKNKKTARAQAALASASTARDKQYTLAVYDPKGIVLIKVNHKKLAKEILNARLVGARVELFEAVDFELTVNVKGGR